MHIRCTIEYYVIRCAHVYEVHRIVIRNCIFITSQSVIIIEMPAHVRAQSQSQTRNFSNCTLLPCIFILFWRANLTTIRTKQSRLGMYQFVYTICGIFIVKSIQFWLVPLTFASKNRERFIIWTSLICSGERVQARSSQVLTNTR